MRDGATRDGDREFLPGLGSPQNVADVIAQLLLRNRGHPARVAELLPGSRAVTHWTISSPAGSESGRSRYRTRPRPVVGRPVGPLDSVGLTDASGIPPVKLGGILLTLDNLSYVEHRGRCGGGALGEQSRRRPPERCRGGAPTTRESSLVRDREGAQRRHRPPDARAHRDVRSSGRGVAHRQPSSTRSGRVSFPSKAVLALKPGAHRRRRNDVSGTSQSKTRSYHGRLAFPVDRRVARPLPKLRTRQC